MTAPLLMLDLSNNNAEVNFAAVRAAGVSGVMLKVGQGADYIDPTWETRSVSARAAGLRVGGYYYVEPGVTAPEIQAQRFATLLGAIGRRDLRPAQDLETPGSLTTAGAVADWSRAFSVEVAKRTGTCPMLYSYQSFLEG